MDQNQVSPWKTSIAGIAANAAACTLHPLENVKLRFQASDKAKNNPIQAYRGIADALRTMWAEEGIFSLYRGALVNIVAGSLANSIFFYVYADGKNRYAYDANNPKSFVTIMISIRAAIIAQVLTIPFWVVKTRLALYKEKGIDSSRGGLIVSVVKDMAKNEGPKAFFKGFWPSIFLSSYGVIQMYAYENINFMFGYTSGQKMSKENFLVPFFTGGLAKSVASFTMMPLNVIRLR